MTGHTFSHLDMDGTFTKPTSDGIEWFVRQRGSGPDVVLIPSGEGDCSSFFKTQDLLSQHFTVTTFDMPGMSRTGAPASALQDLDGNKLADQITQLLQDLSIRTATFYGCSSGAVVALSLVVDRPQMVRNAIVHEVPLEVMTEIEKLGRLDDRTITATCQHLFRHVMVEDPAAWDAIGPEYHGRLKHNYVKWARCYGPAIGKNLYGADFTMKPIDWTIGGLTEAQHFFHNVVIAVGAGIPVGLLPSRHFPQVTIPEELAQHITRKTEKYL